MKRRVVALVRVSDEEQAQEGKTGIQRQLDDIHRVAREQRLEIVKLYRLEGISGPLVPDAPEFRELVAHMRQPDIEGLVVAKLDRLMRTDKVSDLAVFRFFESPKRLIWTSSGTPMDITTFEGKILISQQCLFAGKEKSDILERAHRGKAINRTRPDKCPDPMPRGVGFDKATGKYFYTPEAERVKIAFSMVLEGRSLRSIAAELGYKHQRCLRVQLLNPFWIGIRESKYRRGERPSAHGRLKDAPKILREEPIRVRTNLADAPLVPESVWEEAQDRLSQSRRTWMDARSQASPFLLSGLLWCPCGMRFYSKSDRRRGKIGYYYCSSQHNGDGCGSGWFRQDQIDGAITKLVSTTLANKESVERLVLSHKRDRAIQQVQKRIAGAEAEIERLNAQKAKLLDVVKRGLLDLDDPDVQGQFANVRAGLAEQNAVLRRATMEMEVSKIEDVSMLAMQIVGLFKKFGLMAVAERKNLLRKLFSRIVLHPDGRLETAMRFEYANVKPRTDMGSNLGVSLELPQVNVNKRLAVAAGGASFTVERRYNANVDSVGKAIRIVLGVKT